MRALISLAIVVILSIPLFSEDVRILPLTGPIGSYKISPPNGSAGGYLMTHKGQKAICFKSSSATDVYIGSSTVNTANGFPFFEVGDSMCADLASGTTVYFYGDGASADIRVFVSQ